MKKVLFIVPYPIGVAPSQRFRFEQYFSVLKERNYRCDVSSFWSEKAWAILYRKQKFLRKLLYLFLGYIRRILLLYRIHKYDFIFIHREAAPLGPPLIEFAIAKIFRKKIIYDFDDAIWLSNTSDQNSIARFFKFQKKVASICAWSWKVSCGNEFLAEYANKFNAHAVINPTTIDTEYHRSTGDIRAKKKVSLGWTGTHSTSKYLDPAIPVIKQLMNEHELEFIVVSNQDPELELDNYHFVLWDKKDEIKHLDQIDIGIMPLDDTIWEYGKCGFKALQYMALEKPAVVSKVGVNKQIIDHEKNGYLCGANKEWYQYLSLLISSATLRKSIGKQGRKTVEQNYSVASNTTLFLSLFE